MPRPFPPTHNRDSQVEVGIVENGGADDDGVQEEELADHLAVPRLDALPGAEPLHDGPAGAGVEVARQRLACLVGRSCGGCTGGGWCGLCVWGGGGLCLCVPDSRC